MYDYDDSPFEKERQNLKVWLGVFLVLALIIAYFAQTFYWRSVSYTGRVVAKYTKVSRGKHHRGRTYILKIETNKGKTYYQPVSRYLYNKIKVGSWVKKKKGELYPKVVVAPE